MREKISLKTFYIVLLSILIFTIFVFSSCKVTENAVQSSNEDCEYTLNIVREQSQEKTLTKLFMDYNVYALNFIPSDFSILNEMRFIIPGMNMLLEKWSVEVSDFLIFNYSNFSDFTNNLVNELIFIDVQNMVYSSDNTISILYKNEKEDILKEELITILSSLNTSTWQSIITQYNAYVATQRLFGSSEVSFLESNDIVAMVCDLIVDYYFSLFELQETFIRTTPDPDMDFIASYVLGLN